MWKSLSNMYFRRSLKLSQLVLPSLAANSRYSVTATYGTPYFSQRFVISILLCSLVCSFHLFGENTVISNSTFRTWPCQNVRPVLLSVCRRKRSRTTLLSHICNATGFCSSRCLKCDVFVQNGVSVTKSGGQCSCSFL